VLFEVILCPECGVPDFYQNEIYYLNNGDIVQRLDQTNRVCLIECENLDPVFENIAEIMGLSIEEIVITTVARASQLYNEAAIPDELKKMIRTKQIPLQPLAEALAHRGNLWGYGNEVWLEHRWENDPDDFSIQRVTQPFSVPILAGNYAGAVSAAVGGEHGVNYEEEAPGVYLFKTHWTEYPDYIKEMVQIIPYEHHDGDLELERCGTCGGPMGLSVYKWYPEEGLIKHKLLGRRMAGLAVQSLEPVFRVLEEELGDEIPAAVVEAQRRFVRTGFDYNDMMGAEEDLRTGLAIRGLGNLREFKVSGNRFNLELEGACLPLLLLGLIQGSFEVALGIESNIEWELSDDNYLKVEIVAK
jgi:hypothetical protein